MLARPVEMVNQSVAILKIFCLRVLCMYQIVIVACVVIKMMTTVMSRPRITCMMVTVVKVFHMI